MKKILFILFLLPNFCFSQVLRDTIVAIRAPGDSIKYVVYYSSAAYTSGDEVLTRNSTTGKRSAISPLSLPLATIVQTALDLKANSASPTFTGTVSQANATLQSQKYYLAPITTTNATPVLLASIPIATNKSFDIEIYMMAVKSDGSTRNCGYIRGVFSRVTGNLSQDGTLKNDLLGVLSTTKCTFVLNNTTHAVEIYANGLAATTINWNFFLEITNLL